jgi:hypothetical protein
MTGLGNGEAPSPIVLGLTQKLDVRRPIQYRAPAYSIST